MRFFVWLTFFLEVCTYPVAQASLIHGQYDRAAGFYQALELHWAWPEATFWPAWEAGHISSETAILDRLIRATDKHAINQSR